MKAVVAWLDERTGCKKLVHEALYENVPGGARWRYVWGSTLLFTFAVQVITGIFLWMAYSPSSQTAWESVFFIQYQMTGGWLLRGLHHFTAQAMNVLLVLHLLQVVIDGAYKAPREVNFWFGLLLLLLVLGLSLTGYLLPWDQKGLAATKVSTNLIAVAPVFGTFLQKLIVGGPEYGHHTLTRFFALHAGVLPGMVIALIFGHVYLFRKHGITAKRPLRRPDAAFWPDQVFRDAVACLAVLAAVLGLILAPHWLNPSAPLGAELGAPADPSQPFSAARPEWYFLFLFQFLKYFPGTSEIWGAIVIPTFLLLLVFLLPVFARWKSGHRFNLAFLFALLGGAILLTFEAMREDRADLNFQAAIASTKWQAERVKELAASPNGIPIIGAVALLREDPLTQGPLLFAKHCASCHRFGGTDALGAIPKDPPAASDLKNFASRQWLAGLLDPARIQTVHYFGATKFKEGKMARFVTKKVAAFGPAEKEKLGKAIAAVSAQAQLKGQRAADAADAPTIEAGQKIIREELNCTDCHSFLMPDENATAPDLTGYGSEDWVVRFISNPAADEFYGSRNDRMPAFGKDKILDEKSIRLLSNWLRGEWYEPKEAADSKLATALPKNPALNE